MPSKKRATPRSAHFYCFIKDCELKTVERREETYYYIEVLLELRIDGENYLKLAYIGKEFYQTAIKNIKPGLNAEVFGHHVKAFPFDSSKAQQYSELGLFKITKMFFFSNRFTDELETKEDFLAIRRKKNQKHSNNKNINKRNQR